MAEKVTVLNFKFLSYIYWVYLQLVLIQNVLPLDKDGLPYDEGSERASSVEDYKVTCIQFIEDISNDYLAWVDYYKLPPEEDKKRRDRILATVERTNEWIAKVATTIKGQEFDLLDMHLKINAQDCKPRDLISFTVIVSEMREGQEHERRGVTTIIHIT